MHFAGARQGFVFGGPIGDWRCAHAEKLNAESLGKRAEDRGR